MSDERWTFGPQGYVGPMGAVGFVGMQGPIGNVGPMGFVGMQGPIGNVGPMGVTQIQRNCLCHDEMIIFLLQRAVSIHNDIVSDALKPGLYNDVVGIVIAYADVRDYLNKNFIRKHPQYDNVFKNIPILKRPIFSTNECITRVTDDVTAMIKHATIITCDAFHHQLRVCSCYDYDH